MARTHAALLRGINVSGKNKLPMRDLTTFFVEAGCADVQSYIQSGNVVFGAKARLVEELPARIEGAILERFGFGAPVVVRSRAELVATARDNPFLAEGCDAAALHVMFLASAPSAQRIASLDPRRSPTDRFAVRGREIFLHCPHGLGRSKLTNDWFDRQLATTSTCRNWRTLHALIELLGA